MPTLHAGAGEGIAVRVGVPLAALLVSAFLVSGLASSYVNTPDASIATEPPVKPLVTGSSPKVHVVELFTGTWCPPCANGDPPLGRIADEWGEDLILLEYHHGPSSDPFYDAGVYDVRRDFYVPGTFGIPTVIFDGGGAYADGTLVSVGASVDKAANYDSYRISLQDNTDTASNLAMSIEGDLTPTAAMATVTVLATDPVPQTNLFLRTVLYEDALYHMGTNSQPYHRHTARALNERPIQIAQGQVVTEIVTFTVDPTWNSNKLGVAAFVQSADRTTVTSGGYQFTISDILNAARHDFVSRGLLVHRDRGTTADYEETYEKLLSIRDEHFDTWNELVAAVDTGATDDRGMPSAARLADTPLVVWHTGPERTGTLTANERALLAEHLDGGGSLLLTGSNAGFELWTSAQTWFTTYLHAAFEGDDTGDTAARGVPGDPVGDAFAATDLNILGSPDRIDAQPGAFVPFQYAGSGFPASVRAQHDADSRVVYLGFEYFENTIDPSREAVMEAILDWIDGAAAPSVNLLSANGCELLTPGSTYDLRWEAHDVRIPANGVDIYFATNYGPSPTWESLAVGEPNDGLYRWVVPNRNSDTVRVRIDVRDGDLLSPDGTGISASDFMIGPAGSDVPCSLTFTDADLGMRLLSIPLVLSDPSTANVLASMDGNFRLVRAYVPTDGTDPWKAFVPAKAYNDLARIDHTMAFWLEVTGPGDLVVVGRVPSAPVAIALQAGWNLVGFPSMVAGYTVADLKAATGATRVEGFDAIAAPYYLQVLPDAHELRAWGGYWVYAPQAATWTVPV